MLEIGNGGMNEEEEKTHFALWAIAKAPLLIGCDLSKVQQSSLDILTNSDIIAVNQQAKYQAYCVKGCDDQLTNTLYATEVADGGRIALLINWSDQNLTNYTLKASDVGILPKDGD